MIYCLQAKVDGRCDEVVESERGGFKGGITIAITYDVHHGIGATVEPIK
jgi:hypothetical protein